MKTGIDSVTEVTAEATSELVVVGEDSLDGLSFNPDVFGLTVEELKGDDEVMVIEPEAPVVGREETHPYNSLSKSQTEGQIIHDLIQKHFDKINLPSANLPESQEWKNELFNNLKIGASEPHFFSEASGSFHFFTPVTLTNEQIILKLLNFLELTVATSKSAVISRQYSFLNDLSSDECVFLVCTQVLKNWWKRDGDEVRMLLQKRAMKDALLVKNVQQCLSITEEFFKDLDSARAKQVDHDHSYAHIKSY